RLARVLDKLVMKQTAAPAAVSTPFDRLWAFDPVRTDLNLKREVELIREERRAQARKAPPPAPPILAKGTIEGPRMLAATAVASAASAPRRAARRWRWPATAARPSACWATTSLPWRWPAAR